MSVTIIFARGDPDHQESAGPHGAGRPGRPNSAGRPLSIGLLNNMPDGALEATERQFVNLLNAASAGIAIRLSLYYLPGIPRSQPARAYMDQRYRSADLLNDSDLDGLIVTGREPLSPRLQDEPYWNNFVRVLEWSQENTCSTVWSCLAAHAAVLHMDGIERRRSEQKHCGVFRCERVAEHPLTASLPVQFHLPHSRWNGLPEDELSRCGYQILSRADGAGVDSFIRQGRSLFLFFQGHPEYEADTLLLEYRRDVMRYLRGESITYPSLPRGYFDQEGMERTADIQHAISARPQEETVAMLAALRPPLNGKNGWSAVAAGIYENWLEYIDQEKRSRSQIGIPTAKSSAQASRGTKHNAQMEFASIAEPQ
jgi:homoserine O-succinyltransferase/O-acetyltransferase